MLLFRNQHSIAYMRRQGKRETFIQAPKGVSPVVAQSLSSQNFDDRIKVRSL